MLTAYSKTNPLHIAIRERTSLTKRGSTKSTFHIVLDAGDMELDYKVGDSIGVLPKNPDYFVMRALQVLKASESTLITHTRSGEEMPLSTFLEKHVNFARIPKPLAKLYAAEAPKLAALLENPEEWKAYTESKDLIDFLSDHRDISVNLQELCDTLAPLLPRFYSIASSPLVHPTEIHLTVGITQYHHNNETRRGIATDYLCYTAEIGVENIPIYLQSSPHFTLPENNAAPIIMIGPGTGIAPFRGFLQERAHRLATGTNWLFFGERHSKTDFYYEEELTCLVEEGFLRLNVAFSRDNLDKRYVQHEMEKEGADLWQLIENGAYFYVCGDAEKMAKDVDATLHQIAQTHGKLSPEEATQFFKQKRKEKFYRQDIY